MAKKIDLTGLVFGRLTVVCEADKRNKAGSVHWKCVCSCEGKIIEVASRSLRVGTTKSCGCLQRENIARVIKSNIVHGMCYTRVYYIWRHMVGRCTNPNDKKYPSYGGRGITICDRWLKFENFYEDMGDPPTKEHSLDRVDNDGNYEPKNCRWSTPKVQSRNTRRNVLITHQGKTQCLSAWAEETGIGSGTLQYRLKNGWSIERTLNEPAVLGKNQHI